MLGGLISDRRIGAVDMRIEIRISHGYVKKLYAEFGKLLNKPVGLGKGVIPSPSLTPNP